MIFLKLHSFIHKLGLTEARVEKIREAARKLDLRGNTFKTGLECKELRKQVIRITTGSAALDLILGGGIETSSITELFGEFRTGKSQLCHTLCVTCQLAFENKGGQAKTVYLDTEGNFRPERIEAIAERFGLDPEQTLENIIVARVFSHEEQMETVKLIAALIADPDQGPFRLLVIDSIIALFRAEFSGRGELSERQQKLGQHLSHLVKVDSALDQKKNSLSILLSTYSSLFFSSPLISSHLLSSPLLSSPLLSTPLHSLSWHPNSMLQL